MLFYLYTATPFLLAIYLSNIKIIPAGTFVFLLFFWAFLFRPVVFFYMFKEKAGFQPKDIWNCLNPIWQFQQEAEILFR